MVKVPLTASSVTALTLVLGLPTASAQQADDPTASGIAGLEEVTVTAQRRVESLQDAAIPVQTLSLIHI